MHKNHGYELEDNYGHGQQTLSMVFYLLNLLAFVAHQVLELGDRLYQQCRLGESRRGLSNVLRALFGYVAVESWEGLLLHHLEAESPSSERPLRPERFRSQRPRQSTSANQKSGANLTGEKSSCRIAVVFRT